MFASVCRKIQKKSIKFLFSSIRSYKYRPSCPYSFKPYDIYGRNIKLPWSFITPGEVIWQRMKDSNPHKQSQSLVCYHYTNPLFCALLNDRRLLYQNSGICQPFFESFPKKTGQRIFAVHAAKSPDFSAHQSLQSPPRPGRLESLVQYLPESRWQSYLQPPASSPP